MPDQVAPVQLRRPKIAAKFLELAFSSMIISTLALSVFFVDEAEVHAFGSKITTSGENDDVAPAAYQGLSASAETALLFKVWSGVSTTNQQLVPCIACGARFTVHD